MFRRFHPHLNIISKGKCCLFNYQICIGCLGSDKLVSDRKRTLQTNLIMSGTWAVLLLITFGFISEGIPSGRINNIVIMSMRQLQPVTITVSDYQSMLVCDGISHGRQQGSVDYHLSLCLWSSLRLSLATWISIIYKIIRAFLWSDRTTTPTVTHTAYSSTTQPQRIYCGIDSKNGEGKIKLEKSGLPRGHLLYK